MKRFLYGLGIVLIFSVLFAGCGKKETVNTNQPVQQANQSQPAKAQVAKIETQPNSDKTPNSNNGKPDIGKQKPGDTNVNDEERLKQYLNNLKERDKIEEYYGKRELLPILKDDIDGDGNTEMLASFGTDGGEDEKSYDKNYLLRKTDKGFQEIKTDIESGGYYINGIELVKLDNSKNKYIYVKITNGAHPLGCAVYGLKNNTLQTLFYDSSATGAGEYMLIDNDKDGIHDEVVTYRSDYGVYYHSIETHYKWNGNDFSKGELTYDLEHYPDKPEKVIEHYLDILWLERNYEANGQTRKRIKDIILNKEVNKVDLSSYVENFYADATYDENNLMLEKKIQEDGHVEFIGSLKSGELKSKLTFGLRMDKGKWRIEAIKKSG